MKRLNWLICVIAISVFPAAFGCGADGKDGADGMDGTACTVTENANNTFSIICEDGTSVTIPAGKDGADGESCSVTDNGDGTYDLVCPDGTITFSDGSDGADGEDGADGTGCIIEEKQDTNNDTYYEITCGEGDDATSVDIYPPGACTVEENQDGTATISCPDGTSVDISKGVDGDSCSVAANAADPDNCYDITCGDNTVTVCDGEHGDSCSVVVNDTHDHCYDITCGVDTVTVCDGTSTLITVDPVEPGVDCPNGGYLVTTCEDDGTGACVTDTIEESYVCHGEDGQQGEKGDQGDPGEEGTSTLITVDPVEPDVNCPNGGYLVTTCEDDGTGACVTDTIEESYVCHGDQGEQGEKGDQGEPGQDGQDGEPCTVVDNHDGTITISCPDGTSVTIWGQVAPHNSTCSGAYEFPVMYEQTIEGNTEYASANSPGTAEGPATWYKFTVLEPTTVTLTMNATWGTDMYLLEGDCENYTIVAEHANSITADLDPGEYLVVTTGVTAGDYGDFTLDVHFVESVAVLWRFDAELEADKWEPDVGYGVIIPGDGLGGEGFVFGLNGTSENTDRALTYNNWSTGELVDDKYLEFSVDLSGFEYIGFSFWGRRSGEGPLNLDIYYAVDGGAYTIVDTKGTAETWQQLVFDLSAITELDDAAEASIRIYGYNAGSSGGTMRFDDVTFTGYPLY